MKKVMPVKASEKGQCDRQEESDKRIVAKEAGQEQFKGKQVQIHKKVK